MSKPAPSGPTLSNSSRDAIGTTTAAESAGDTSGLSQTLQGHVDDIRSLIQCGICIRPLYEPFTLGCGHTFCYTCLTSWFGGGRSNKTCPDCRTPVKSEPSPAYLVRAVVQLFTSRAELLDKGETTAEHIHHQREEAEKIDKDKKNPHPREGGLFKGTFSRARNSTAPPVVDLEDGVLRCPQCSWELEEDSNCIQCGYRPRGSVTDSSDYLSDDLDENSEMTDYFDDEAEDGLNEVDDYGWNGLYDGVPIDALPFDIQHLYELHRNHYPHQPRHVLPTSGPRIPAGYWNQNDAHDSEEEEEEEEDTDMDSFIDDDENEEHYPVRYDNGEYDTGSDRSTVVGGPEYITQENRYEERHDFPMPQLGDFVSDSVSEVTGTEEEEEEEEEEEDDDDDNSDDDNSDDDESDDDDEPVRPAVSGNRRRPIPYFQISSSPVQPRLMTSNGHPAQSRTASRARNAPSAGTSASNAIRLEDDSDEGPVRPARRVRR